MVAVTRWAAAPHNADHMNTSDVHNGNGSSSSVCLLWLAAVGDICLLVFAGTRVARATLTSVPKRHTKPN